MSRNAARRTRCWFRSACDREQERRDLDRGMNYFPSSPREGGLRRRVNLVSSLNELVATTVASQRPITLGANTSPAGTAAWKSLPSWAVVGTEDKVIPPATLRSMAERAGATITEVAASHVSLVSQPQASLDAILAAVAAVGE